MDSLVKVEINTDIGKKLLEMIGKSVGLIFPPIGNMIDTYEGLEFYKERLKNDQSLAPIEQAVRISFARRDFIQYRNQVNITNNALNNLTSTASLKNIDSDWLIFFFEYAKNISSDNLQEIWGKLLANRINGKNKIPKKLIHFLSVVEDDDIDIFCKICSMIMDSEDREVSKYPFIYIKDHPGYYNSYGIRRYNLRSLADLGIINYDIGDEFVLPSKVPILRYGDKKIKLSSDARICYGNIVLTLAGSVLYGMTERDYNDDFIEFCKKVWDERNIQYEIFT
jgi:hypothetical protein